jgi:signal transduction histidine kinase
MVALNEALVLSSLRQHKLTAAANSSNVRLTAEIGERKQAERALRRAQTQLRDRAGQLEGLVAKRTAQLTATNQRLERSVDSIEQGKEKYRLLLLESQVIRGKLSQLTRQILTAQEDERKQISRELHDEVVQTLVGINVELAALANANTVGGLHMKKKIVRTQRLVENSVGAVHRFARGLRPAVLDDLGLVPALDAFCSGLAARKRIKIRTTAFAGIEALGDAEQTALFRVAQETLTNVARHARATEVDVVLSLVGGAIRMEISDNGKSFHVSKTLKDANYKRLGLMGVRERIERVGGSLTIESTLGRGTTIRAEIPFALEKTKK